MLFKPDQPKYWQTLLNNDHVWCVYESARLVWPKTTLFNGYSSLVPNYGQWEGYMILLNTQL